MVIKTITFQQTVNFTEMTVSKVVQNWKHGEKDEKPQSWLECFNC